MIEAPTLGRTVIQERGNVCHPSSNRISVYSLERPLKLSPLLCQHPGHGSETKQMSWDARWRTTGLYCFWTCRRLGWSRLNATTSSLPTWQTFWPNFRWTLYASLCMPIVQVNRRAGGDDLHVTKTKIIASDPFSLQYSKASWAKLDRRKKIMWCNVSCLSDQTNNTPWHDTIVVVYQELFVHQPVHNGLIS